MNRPNKREDERRPTLEEVGLTPEDCAVSEDDPREWLEGPEDYAAYLNEALATGEARVVAHCLKQIAVVMGTSLPGDVLPGVHSLLDTLRSMNLQLRVSEKAVQ